MKTLSTTGILNSLERIGRDLAYWSNPQRHSLEDHWKATDCEAALQQFRRAYASIRAGEEAASILRDLRFATSNVWQARGVLIIEIAATTGFDDTYGWTVADDRILPRIR